MSGPLLEISGLRAGYGASTVLDGVELAIDAGEVVALLGRNGVGKSTLIAAVMGWVRPSAGTIRLGGADIGALATHRIARAGVAVVPQGRRVFAPLTVHGNLRIAVPRRGASGPWTIERIYALMPRLDERRHNRGDQLSGGEQQMLAIARALLLNPKVLLLDEPSEGLAPAVVDQVIQIITALRGEGLSVLLVEQDLRATFAMSDRVAVMAKGRIVHDSSTEDFRRDRVRGRRLLGVS